MRECIYCRTTKPISDFSLEHVIPQFLGGNLTPDFLKTNDVCKKCNNDLGLFVDASFNKDWLVHNSLTSLYTHFYASDSCTIHPFSYIGSVQSENILLQNNEICETWLGPNGDIAFWIKKRDERFITYVGNNPRNNKDKPSIVYHILSKNMLISNKHALTSFISFKEFFKNKKIRKIASVPQIIIHNTSNVIFELPYETANVIDKERLHRFIMLNKNEQQSFFSTDINYDYRFMAKLAIGISYCLFGKSGIIGAYAEELYKAIWYRKGDTEPAMLGSSNFSEDTLPDSVKNLLTNSGAITITVAIIFDSLSLHLNIGSQHWTLKLADISEIRNITNLPPCFQGFGNGFVLIIYPAINKAIYREFAQYIQYKLGATDPELDAINEKIIK